MLKSSFQINNSIFIDLRAFLQTSWQGNWNLGKRKNCAGRGEEERKWGECDFNLLNDLGTL